MTDDPFVALFEEWFELSRSHSMRHFIGYARESGLSMSQIGALFHLNKAGKCGVTELGGHLNVSNAAVSQMLDRLAQQGLILRSEDPQDRRSKTIVMTEKGEQILQEGLRARQSWLQTLTNALSDGEKETIMEGLNILVEKIGKLEEPIPPTG